MHFDNIDELRAYYAHDEFARECLGARIDSYDFETHEVCVSMDVDERHHNALGTVMGGVMFSLADFALAVACNTDQPDSCSVNHSIDFMCMAKDAHLVACARPEKMGRKLAFFTVDVRDGVGTKVARMSATVFRLS